MEGTVVLIGLQESCGCQREVHLVPKCFEELRHVMIIANASQAGSTKIFELGFWTSTLRLTSAMSTNLKDRVAHCDFPEFEISQ
jgi:hypothetical protein